MHRRMQWISVLTVALSMLAFGLGVSPAQNSQPARGKLEVSLSGKKVTLDYGRPEMKGRDLLAMAPDGFVWRFGANQSTTFMAETDLMFGAKKLAKGTYSAWIKHVSGDQWALIFNSEVGIWGLPGAKRENDVLEVPLTYSKNSTSVERFTVELMNHTGSGHMLISWGTHRLETMFKPG